MSIKQLIEGKMYTVVKEFIDYDKIVHPVGEQWIFNRTTFTAYYDGLSLWVTENGTEKMYRLQQLPYEQEELINTFADYVVLTEAD